MDLRVIEQDGQPWFVGKDVADALGFTIDNMKYHAKQSFQDDEKRVVKLPGFRGFGVLVLNESGLYKLVMRSDKPEARAFQDWVTRVVLPAIRKDGAYVLKVLYGRASGLAHVYTRLAPDEMTKVNRYHFGDGPGKPITLISESGLYKLVMRSDKPEARAFQDWVTRVVLPAIRKDGAYVLGEEKVVTGEISEDELILRAMQAQQKKVDRLVLERDRLQAHNGFFRPVG